jgi:hypothetical protein
MRKPKPKDKTEWWVKGQVKRILEETGWTFWMPSADVYGRSGVSDFLAVKSPKLFMAIETKYDDVVTALQFKFLTDIHDTGHYAFLVDETNIEELREVLITNVPSQFKSLLKWKDQAIKLDVKLTT